MLLAGEEDTEVEITVEKVGSNVKFSELVREMRRREDGSQGATCGLKLCSTFNVASRGYMSSSVPLADALMLGQTTGETGSIHRV